MNETATFLNSISDFLNDLTVVGLIALIVILVFICLKMGWIKLEWFFIPNRRADKLDQMLGLLQKFDENDFKHTCQTDDMNRLNDSMKAINASMKAINESFEKVMLSMERTSEILRQMTTNQKEICDKYDTHDMQARDIKNICTNIWEKKCKAF
jgi:methyl-accepting chemotaxis protein